MGPDVQHCHESSTGESRSLLHHPDFRHLWSAETVSQVGTQVSLLAIPLMAIYVLHATTFQVGALEAVQFAPFVIVGLPAGAIIDRVRRRPVMMMCDLGRAAALASLPLVHAYGTLTIWQLYVVVFANGVMTVFFDVANMSILPSLVDRDQIPDGNAKLEVSRSGAQVAGPGLAGLLVQWIGSVTAVLVDAISFVGSALFLSRIRTAEPPVDRHEGIEKPRLRTEVREGLAYVWQHPLLRPIALCTATSNLFSSMISAVFIVYAVRQLHYSAGTVGLMFVFGGVGAVLGALLYARVTRPIGIGPAIVSSIFVGGLGMLLLGLAPRASAFVWFVIGWMIFSFTGVVYNVNQGSLRQVITVPRMQGRMNASMRFMVWGTMPFGALIGGALGSAIGVRETLLLAGIGSVLPVAWVLWSPVRTLREMPAGPQLRKSRRPSFTSLHGE